MQGTKIKVFKLNYSGIFEEIDTETVNLFNCFTLVDILAIYITIQKRLYIWIPRNVTQSLKNYIPGIRMRFSEKLPNLKILRNITVESGSEPFDFFQFLDFTWDQLNDKIKEQETKLEPIIKEIDALKKELTNFVNNKEFEDGIKISEQIINLAKELNDKALENEYKDLIEELKRKIMLQTSDENIKEEALDLKNKFDELIKTNKSDDIVEIHKIIIEFKKKYEKNIDLTSIPLCKELLESEEKLWYNFTRDQKEHIKELEKLKNQLRISMNNYEFSTAVEIITKAKDLLLIITDNDVKKKWNEIEINFIEWKRKNVTIKEIEKSIEECTFLKENYQFEEAFSLINSSIDLLQDKELLEYDAKLKEKQEELEKAKKEYIKLNADIAALDGKIKENRKNKQLNAALIYCKKIIQLCSRIKKPDFVLTYSQYLEEIQKEIDFKTRIVEEEQIELRKKAKELENVINIDNENVLPIVEEFSVEDILGDLSDDVNEMLNQVGNLLSEHRVEIKEKITNKALVISVSGEVIELEKELDVQPIENKEEMIKYGVQSSLINLFEDIIEEAVITDLIPYNFEIKEIQLNGQPVEKLPDKTLVKGGVELKWQIQNIPPKEKVEIDYELRRRVSRTIIFILKGQVKIIKTHSNLNKLENLDGLFEAKLPFTNSYGINLDGVIVEDVVPLYYLHFVKEPTNIIPAATKRSNFGELIKWNVGKMESETLNYQYRLLEVYHLEELKIIFNSLSKNGLSALDKGDLTEAIEIYDDIINKLEEYNK